MIACNLLTLRPSLQGVLVLPPPISSPVTGPPPLWTGNRFEIQRPAFQSWFNGCIILSKYLISLS